MPVSMAVGVGPASNMGLTMSRLHLLHHRRIIPDDRRLAENDRLRHEHPTDLDRQRGVAALPAGRQPVGPLVVGRRGDRQTVLDERAADRLHTPSQTTRLLMVGVLADEVHDPRPGRSSSHRTTSSRCAARRPGADGTGSRRGFRVIQVIAEQRPDDDLRVAGRGRRGASPCGESSPQPTPMRSC